MYTYTIGALLSFFPRNWREALAGGAPIHWTRATWFGAMASGLVCLCLLIGWYLYFIQGAASEQAGVTLDALTQREPPKGFTGAGASYAMGLASLVAFLLQPKTWVLAYFALEGTVRAVAAAVTDESPASLPFVLMEKLRGAFSRTAYEHRVPLIVDQVTRGDASQGWDLRIASCRPKPDWKAAKSIRYRDEFFRVIGESRAGTTPARPHVYLLRLVPPGEALRGVEDYTAEDVLHPAREPGAMGVGGVFAEWSERRRVARLPRVPDKIERVPAPAGVQFAQGADWDVRVLTCRPKPDWARGRSILFDAAFFKVEESFSGPPERPFGFLLRRIPPNEAVRGPLRYDPE